MTDLSRRKILIGAVAVIAATVSFPHHLWAVSRKKRKPRANIIRIENLKFSPTILEVTAGDTITWVNYDVVPHTATALDKSWDTGLLKKDAKKTIKVTAKMSSEYFCKYHPAMKAKLSIGSVT